MANLLVQIGSVHSVETSLHFFFDATDKATSNNIQCHDYLLSSNISDSYVNQSNSGNQTSDTCIQASPEIDPERNNLRT